MNTYEQMYFDKPYKAAGWDQITYTGQAERKIPS